MNSNTTPIKDRAAEELFSTNQLNFTVNFNGSTVEPSATAITVDENCNVLIFTLSSTAPGTASFHNPPIQAIVGGAAQATVPDFVSFALIDDTQFVLCDLDNVMEGDANVTFEFRIGVDYNDGTNPTTTIWSPDPTIVNTPIT